MPTRAVFRCQFCDAVPDHGTQRSLAGQVSERMFGEYLDAFPGRWLVWNGGGPLGPRRYACREHRGDLVAYLRYHYATVAAQVWKMPPYQQRWPDEKRPHMGGSMGIIKFGLRGGLLQDRPPATPAPPADQAAPDPAPPPDPAASDPAAGPPSPAGQTPAGGDVPPPQAAGGDEELFGPGVLLGPSDDLFGPDGLPGPGDELFPPGELYLPTDGPFATGGDPGIGGESESEGEGEGDSPWPADPDPPPA